MSLNEVWEAAAANPFSPLVPKERQFFVGFTLLLVGKCHPARLFKSKYTRLLLMLHLRFSLDWSLWSK